MTTTTHTLAGEAAACFESVKRDGSEDDYYTRVKDGSPEWLTDLVRHAHLDGEMFPDDWRYACISAAVDAIDEAGEDADLDDLGSEFADGQVDVYTADRYAWLSSNLRRSGYVDDAVSEGLAVPETDTVDRIGLGQYMEATEVYHAVKGFLEERAEEIADEDDDADEDLDVYALNDLCAYLEIPPDQTEQGLTQEASDTIDAFLAGFPEQGPREDLSLRPRPGESAEQTVERVTAAARRQP